MTAQSREWENALLELALNASQALPSDEPELQGQADLLQQAYRYSEAITALNSRSFYMASGLLPSDKKRAVRALYAFCRTTDDLVDDPGPDAPAALCDWWSQSLTTRPATYNPVALAWSDTRVRYQIPRKYAEQLIEGVAHDFRTTRYATFKDLTKYCYGVASTVGLMSMHIIGYSGDEAISYAVKLGVALQLTNILRDIAEDWDRGRLYLPQDELEAFGIEEEAIAAGHLTARWRAFMRFQIERNRRLYREAWPGLATLASEGRLAIMAAADFYKAILEDIETHNFDVFSRRAHLSRRGKLQRLPALWWQARRMNGAYSVAKKMAVSAAHHRNSQTPLLQPHYPGELE